MEASGKLTLSLLLPILSEPAVDTKKHAPDAQKCAAIGQIFFLSAGASNIQLGCRAIDSSSQDITDNNHGQTEETGRGDIGWLMQCAVRQRYCRVTDAILDAVRLQGNSARDAVLHAHAINIITITTITTYTYILFRPLSHSPVSFPPSPFLTSASTRILILIPMPSIGRMDLDPICYNSAST